jgi:hypothetical protein
MIENLTLTGAERIRRLLGPCEAVEVAGAALRAGLDPGVDPAGPSSPPSTGRCC